MPEIAEDSAALPISLRPATPADAALLAQMLQLYVYDFSHTEMPGSGWMDVGADGRFNVHLRPVPVVDGAGSHLILCGEKVAGFAFIDRLNPSGRGGDWNVAEFMVLRKYRRHGVGSAAVAAMAAARPGRWEAAVVPDNSAGLAFWRQTLARWQAEEVPGAGERWTGRPVLRWLVGPTGFDPNPPVLQTLFLRGSSHRPV